MKHSLLILMAAVVLPFCMTSCQNATSGTAATNGTSLTTVQKAEAQAQAVINSPTAQVVVTSLEAGGAAAIQDFISGNSSTALSDAGKAVLASVNAQANGNKALVTISAVGQSVLTDELAHYSSKQVAVDAGLAAAKALLNSPSTITTTTNAGATTGTASPPSDPNSTTVTTSGLASVFGLLGSLFK